MDHKIDEYGKGIWRKKEGVEKNERREGVTVTRVMKLSKNNFNKRQNPSIVGRVTMPEQ